MSTYGATLEYLKKNISEVITSEYYSGKKPGELVNGVRNEDVQELSMPNESIDLITSNQVFEHVPDDIKGYSECFRVLRPGGALIFSIPMSDRPQTLQAAEFVEGQLLHHMEPEYHDSRTEGPNSALVFWHHSQRDICDRVQQAGFVARIMNVMISSVQIVPQKVIYAVKPDI
jgi:ubiquinone/menaquinone biosynthesis C-methylase UbiE